MLESPVFHWPSPAFIRDDLTEGGSFPPDMTQAQVAGCGPIASPYACCLSSSPGWLLTLPRGPQHCPSSTPSVFHTARPSSGNANPNPCTSGLRASRPYTAHEGRSRPAFLVRTALPRPPAVPLSAQPPSPPHSHHLTCLGDFTPFPDYLTCLPRMGFTLRIKE